MRHYSNDLTFEQQKAFNLKGESSDPDVYDSIMPIVDVSPMKIKVANVRSNTLTNGTTVTLLSSQNDRDIYITSACLSVTRDVTATSITSAINIQDQDGVSRDLIRMGFITLTASKDNVSVSFPHPVKIKRNSNVYIVNNTNVANIISCGSITYFEIID